MIVFKNHFIGSDKAENMHEIMTSNNFGWYYFKSSCSVEFLEGFHISPIFRHAFVVDGEIKSEFIYLIEPILFNLREHFKQDLSIVHIQANLLPESPHKIGALGLPHIDKLYPEEIKNSYTGLYYMHDNDQETVVYNEKFYDSVPEKYTVNRKIKPVKDTFVFWESNRYHSAPAGTIDTRMVINFNFYL